MCDVSQFCNEKMFEVCATQLDLGNYYIIIICIYRSLAGDHAAQYLILNNVFLSKGFNLISNKW